MVKRRGRKMKEEEEEEEEEENETSFATLSEFGKLLHADPASWHDQ